MPQAALLLPVCQEQPQRTPGLSGMNEVSLVLVLGGFFIRLDTPNWAPLSGGGSRLPVADNPQQLPHPSPLSAPAVLIRALSVSSLSMYEHAWPRAWAGTWLQQRHTGLACSCGVCRMGVQDGCAGWVCMGATHAGVGMHGCVHAEVGVHMCTRARVDKHECTHAGVSVHGRMHPAVGVHGPVHAGAGVHERAQCWAGTAVICRAQQPPRLPFSSSPHLLPEPCAPLTFAVSQHRKHLLLQRPALS